MTYKFNPDWMKDPKIMEEVIRDIIKERDDIIANQQRENERYRDALVKIANPNHEEVRKEWFDFCEEHGRQMSFQVFLIKIAKETLRGE